MGRNLSMFPFHGSTGHRKVRTGSSGVPPAEPELRPGMAERCSRRTGKGAGGCTPSGGGRSRTGGMDVSVSAISRSRTRKRREPSLVSLSSRVAAASSTVRHAAGGGRTGSSGEADRGGASPSPSRAARPACFRVTLRASSFSSMFCCSWSQARSSFSGGSRRARRGGWKVYRHPSAGPAHPVRPG